MLSRRARTKSKNVWCLRALHLHDFFMISCLQGTVVVSTPFHDLTAALVRSIPIRKVPIRKPPNWKHTDQTAVRTAAWMAAPAGPAGAAIQTAVRTAI